MGEAGASRLCIPRQEPGNEKVKNETLKQVQGDGKRELR